MKHLLKKQFALLLVLLLCLTLCSCAGKSKLENFAPEDALLIVDGEVLMTVQDFRHLSTEQAVSHDILDTDTLSEKKLFIQQAELAFLAYTAEQNGLYVERAMVEEEFDNHLAEIQDTDIYGNQYYYSLTLQAALAMDNQTYKTWSVDEAMKDYRLDALLQDIASLYSHITDGEILEEFMLDTLQHMTVFYEVDIYYPGVDINDFDFSDML